MIGSQPRGKNQDVTGISKERGYFSRQKEVLEVKDPHSAHVEMVKEKETLYIHHFTGWAVSFLAIASATIQTNNDKIRRKKKERPAVIQKTEIITEAKSSQGKSRQTRKAH
jgi:hypothetical protein